VLAGNEIELGMEIPTITSRAIMMSRGKRIRYDVCGSNDRCYSLNM